MPVSFAQLTKISDSIHARQYDKVAALCDAIVASPEAGPHWKRDLAKLARVARRAAAGEKQTQAFRILHKKGNSKLGAQFLVFSSLPGIFCEGAGACLEFCYSFKAWRYPAAFCRQAQNAIFLQTEAGRELIAQAFAAVRLPKGQEFMDFRLYVDGDFSDITQVGYWCDLLKSRPEIRAYGYTKSLKLVIDYASGNAMPENYVLNLSAGHKYGPEIEREFSRVTSFRGEFIAVGNKGNLKYATSEYKKAAREAFAKTGDKRKPFICPGTCGTCTPKGHACGSKKFNNIPVVILAH